jgi:hypothetical protein
VSPNAPQLPGNYLFFRRPHTLSSNKMSGKNLIEQLECIIVPYDAPHTPILSKGHHVQYSGKFCMIDQSTLRINFRFRMHAVGECAHAQLVALVTLARPRPIAFHVPSETLTWHPLDCDRLPCLQEYLDCCRWIEALAKNRYRDSTCSSASDCVWHRSKVTHARLNFRFA